VQMHVTLGHTTVMAEAQYFGLPDSSSHSPAAALALTISRISQLALNVSTLLANMILPEQCAIQASCGCLSLRASTKSAATC